MYPSLQATCPTSSTRQAPNVAMEVSLLMADTARSSREVGAVSASVAMMTMNLRYQPIGAGCFLNLLARFPQGESFT